MSTPLIVLAAILALFALVLIPLMMFKSGQQHHRGQQHAHGKHEKKPHRKKQKH
jgi:hypothetical protein